MVPQNCINRRFFKFARAHPYSGRGALATPVPAKFIAVVIRSVFEGRPCGTRLLDWLHPLLILLRQSPSRDSVRVRAGFSVQVNPSQGFMLCCTTGLPCLWHSGLAWVVCCCFVVLLTCDPNLLTTGKPGPQTIQDDSRKTVGTSTLQDPGPPLCGPAEAAVDGALLPRRPVGVEDELVDRPSSVVVVTPESSGTCPRVPLPNCVSARSRCPVGVLVL